LYVCAPVRTRRVPSVAVRPAAVAAGGKDNGAPGERAHYHPGHYAAFVLDPDSNNIGLVYHGEAQRSAASVRISFSPE
jgi:hypothetical protein